MKSLRLWCGWALGLALMLLLLVWGISHWSLRNHTQLVTDRLVLLAELRRGAVQEYFTTAEAELRFWSTNPDLLSSQQALLEVFGAAAGGATLDDIRRLYIEDNPHPQGYLLNLDDAGDNSRYSALHAQLHPQAKLFVTQRSYYDFFLIAPGGEVLYTVEKEADFGTNLESGVWRDTGLARVFKRAKQTGASGTVIFSDMEPYAPSVGAPAMFMAAALHDKDGEFIGVLALQLPIDRILGIMAYTAGMGDSGETYLVGQDKLMRSDSRFAAESTVLVQKVDTVTVNLALQGEEGAGFAQDYRGIEVLSVYLPMPVGNATWAVMAEIDREEIKIIAARERPSMTGALLIMYGLSLWSVWYWRGRQMPGSDGLQLADVEFPDAAGGGLGG